MQDEFVARVQAAGIACTVRDTRGREIAAACGQLAVGVSEPPTARDRSCAIGRTTEYGTDGKNSAAAHGA